MCEEKITLLDNKTIKVEGIYTNYGGEDAIMTISIDENWNVKLIIDESGEMDFIFKTDLQSFQTVLYEKKGKIYGNREYSGQTENSVINLQSMDKENMILKVDRICKSVIFSKKTSEEILEILKEKYETMLKSIK